MTVADRAWFERNVGYDFIAEPPPNNTFAFQPAATRRSDQDLQREIIDFDSNDQPGLRFLAYSTSTGLSRFIDIPWPAGLAPRTATESGGEPGGPLPKADVLVVTWTVDEGHALSRVLTPGKDSHDDYLDYTHNYAAIAQDMVPTCPARMAKRLGAYWMAQIGEKHVVVFKSDSHMSQDGPLLPNRTVWRQIIEEVSPTLVITTGTAGGIGPNSEVGDVIASPVVRFDCTSKFKSEPFATADYSSQALNTALFAQAQALFKVNAGQLPKDNTRDPAIVVDAPGDLTSSVVTTDLFGFDTSDDHYHLQGLGAVSEMGDAVLGLVAKDLGPALPQWVAVRNVSDPQIAASVGDLTQQKAFAAQIYKAYGRWSSICSAIVCWALIAA